ncbi:amino acid ABC transporter permease [Jiangella anatolica]|uniref:Amino acid ABC transporter permease n=1 Tax=Jiangella anatolica TaxID=2670374 RepID=A0A2W2B795_9ACTN|nr:amino acid ABC transporter permease [Jiangella anatolica]PZF81932.1 amino acid ABC transporter permease [Jiangella anatolica]
MTTEDVLFDHLGPRAHRRIRTVTLWTAAGIAGVVAVVLAQLSAAGQLDPVRWRVFTEWDYQRFLLDGFVSTLRAGAVAVVLSLPLGTVLGLMRLSRRWWIAAPATAAIEFLRSIPLILLIYFFLLGLPAAGVVLPTFWQLTVPIVLHAGAVFAEIVRAGVLSLDRGQVDAGYAIGLTHTRTTTLIVLPQVLRSLRPALVSQVVRVIKETSLGYVVSYPELLYSGKILGEFTGDFLQAYIGVAVLFVAVNIALSQLAEYLDRRSKT